MYASAREGVASLDLATAQQQCKDKTGDMQPLLDVLLVGLLLPGITRLVTWMDHNGCHQMVF